MKGMATHASIFAWRIPWTEESWGAAVHGGVPKESDTTEQLNNSNERVLELLALLISRGLLVVTDLSDLL